MIWPFKTKNTEKRNYDRKDLAFSFQSQITVHARTSLRGEQFRLAGDNRKVRSPVFLFLHSPLVMMNKSFVIRTFVMQSFYFPLFFDRESCLIQKMVMFLVVPMTESETQKRKADVSVPRE